MSNTQFNFFDFLLKKIYSYNKEKCQAFHTTHEKAFPTKSLYIWEEENVLNSDAFVFYGPQFAVYFDVTGLEKGLTSYTKVETFKKNWEANMLLYNKSLNLKTFKLVNPIDFRIYKENDIEYVLYTLQHPDNELGEYIFTNQTNIDWYYNLFISEVETLLKNIKSVIHDNQNLSLGYPSLRLPDLLKNNQGCYWRYLFLWELSPEGVYSKIIGDVEKCLETFPRQGQAAKFDVLKEAESRWKSVLNI